MASIVKKNTKSNIPTWLIRVSVGKNFDTGKYIYHNEIFKGSKDGALKRANELECNKSKISITLKKDHLFESLVKKFIKSKIGKVRNSVITGYENDLKHLNRVFAGKNIKEITPSNIEELFQNMLKKGLSQSTIYRVYVIGSKIMETAIGSEIVFSNPFKKVIKPKKINSNLNIPTTKSIQTLLKFLYENKTIKFLNYENKQFLNWGYLATFIAISTGATRSEIIGLRWEDINFEKSEITFKRNVTDLGKFSINYFKNKDENRTLKINKKLLDLFILFKQEQDNYIESSKYKISMNLSWVFFNPSSKEKLMMPNSLTHLFKKAAKSCNLSNLKFQDLRHFHAVNLLKSGRFDIVYVQKRLGHKNVNSTLNNYGKFVPINNSSHVENIDEELLPS